ncbi:MAG: adenylate/guanylate cyclase domain-containing protein [Aeromicrobium sp.]
MTGAAGADKSDSRICASCGGDNPLRFPLCGYCGTEFPVIGPPKAVRKAVTIVFSDLMGSTSLAERLDSEAMGEVITAYFAEMQAALEGHGGTIEKFIGDAVMAVFGVPTVHEDDALRAVRAALEMKERLIVLNDDLERRYGVRLANRTGVNTGELVAGGSGMANQRLVIGDAVNVAARLEQAAPANDILIGDSTYRLVRGVVEIEEMEPLELKGKSERVPAYRLIAVHDGEALARHHERPMIGRERELSLLNGALDEAISAHRGRMVTVLAQAGMGKSRLTHEFAAAVEPQAQVLRGRCLSYGRGITYWPLIEIVRQAASISDDDPPGLALAKLSTLAGDDAVAERVASVMGLQDAQFPVEEIKWGARKLLERVADQRPLVVIFDDIHWAELTLLELIEHLAESAEAPVLAVCPARPDLLELRADWPEPRIILKSLTDADMGRIVENALGRGDLADEIRDRILVSAQGNPLFIEQMLSMLVDDGTLVFQDGLWSTTVELSDVIVPPTIQSLLTSRVEQLGRDERETLEPGAVIGQEFPEEAVKALLPEDLRPRVGERLELIAAKQLIRPNPDALTTESGYRFEHLLIRDAVYKRLVKRSRATLHERFVRWAQEVNRSRDREQEYQEILAYHLEQAHHYLAELAPLDAHGQSIGLEAADWLAAAGQRAFGRGDMPAAAQLLRRAAGLLPDDAHARLELLPDLGEALVDIGEYVVAQVYLDEAIDRAKASGETRLEARAELVRLLLHAHSSTSASWADQAMQGAERVIPVFRDAHDSVGLAAAYRLLAWALGTECRYEDAASAAKVAIEHASAGGDDRQHRRASVQYALAAVWGPTPVPEAIEHCREIVSQARGDRRTVGVITSLLGRLEAMRGEFSTARSLIVEARVVLEDMGRTPIAASTSLDSCAVNVLAGDPAEAERDLRRDYAALEGMGEKYMRCTVASELARALIEEGRDAEAEHYTEIARELAAVDDLSAQVLWRSVRARAMARRGQQTDAVALAREAVALLRGTDSLVAQADALCDLAEVLMADAQSADASAALAEALGLYERKGDLASAARARALLVESPARG